SGADRPDGAAGADQADRRIQRQPVRGLYPGHADLLHPEYEPDAAHPHDRDEGCCAGPDFRSGDMLDFSQLIPALPGLWDGMLVTLQLMVLGVLGGVVLGTLLALMRLSHSRLLSNLAATYVNYFRSIPLLLVIAWFYFAVPFILRE